MTLQISLAEYHANEELKRLREELSNANKTIEHLTAAYKVLRDRLDLAHQHNRTLRKLMIEKARKERDGPTFKAGSSELIGEQ